MQFREVSYEDGTPFDGYGPGFFRLAGKVHEGNVIVSPGGVQPWAGHAEDAPLLALAGEVDFVLMGTGDGLAPIPAALRKALEGAGLGVELMSTPSACRTYNVLLSEGRRVAAAVLAL